MDSLVMSPVLAAAVQRPTFYPVPSDVRQAASDAWQAAVDAAGSERKAIDLADVVCMIPAEQWTPAARDFAPYWQEYVRHADIRDQWRDGHRQTCVECGRETYLAIYDEGTVTFLPNPGRCDGHPPV